MPETCTTPRLHARDGVEVYYEGSKSFWKTRQNIDVAIICHTHYLTVEILVFDPTTGIEANHLYCNSVQLAGKVDQQELQEKLSQKKEVMIRQKKLFNATQVTKELLVQGMANYILARLQITPSEEEGTLLVELCGLAPLEQDSLREVEMLCEKPSAIVPIHCRFAKKLKSTDINIAIHQLKSEASALKSATRLAELSISSIDGFKLMLAEKMRLEKEIRANYSQARLRWIRSINRILVQNYVNKVRERLIVLGHDDWAKVGDADEEAAVAAANRLLQSQSQAILKPPKLSLASNNFARAHSTKISRRSLDSMMSLNTPSGKYSSPKASDLPPVYSPAHSMLSKKERSTRMRRSLNGELFQALSMPLTSPMVSARPVDAPAPSLMQSFRHISERMGHYTPLVGITPDSATIRLHAN